MGARKHQFIFIVLIVVIPILFIRWYARNAGPILERKSNPWIDGGGLPSLPIFAGTPPERCDASKLANQRDFATVWMRNFLKDSTRKFALNRKNWELAYIYCNILQGGLCGMRDTGLVFAVGKEILPSLFIARGCKIHATDFPSPTMEWNDTDQQSFKAADLYFPPASDIYSLAEFETRIRFDGVDMNRIPASVLQGQYSFLWSTCSVEHVGTIELGKKFVLNAMEALKPKGIAVHTTEFNLASLDETITEGNIVLWRVSDIFDLEYRLCLQGDKMLAPHFQQGEMKLDLLPDREPYNNHTHIKLVLGGYTISSFGFIIVRGGYQGRSCERRTLMYHEEEED